MKILDAGIVEGCYLECVWPPAGADADDDLVLLAPLRWWAKYIPDGTLVPVTQTFEIRAGFWTDLASDPLDRRGRWDYASVPHDAGYALRGKLETIDGVKVTFTRRDIDDIFYFIMVSCEPAGVWGKLYYRPKNMTTWLAVRAFGQKEWDDDD